MKKSVIGVKRHVRSYQISLRSLLRADAGLPEPSASAPSCQRCGLKWMTMLWQSAIVALNSLKATVCFKQSACQPCDGVWTLPHPTPVRRRNWRECDSDTDNLTVTSTRWFVRCAEVRHQAGCECLSEALFIYSSHSCGASVTFCVCNRAQQPEWEWRRWPKIQCVETAEHAKDIPPGCLPESSIKACECGRLEKGYQHFHL